MKSAKRFITACLTATMIFQALAPSTEVLAQEVDAAGDAAVQAAFALDGAVNGAKSRIAQLAADAGKAVSAGDGASSDSASTSGDDTENPAAGDTTGGNASESNGEQPSSGDTGEAPSDADDDATAGDDQTTDDAAQDAADEQADENADAEKAAAGATITSAENLKKAIENTGGTSHGTVTVEGDKATSIVCSDATALLMISNTEASIYEHASITRSGSTGASWDLSKEADGYSFQGFGSEEHPFAGTFDLGNGTLTVARTLYNGLSLTGVKQVTDVTWKGTGADNPILAKKIVGNGKTLNATVTIDDIDGLSPGEADPGITGALLGTVEGDLSIEVNYKLNGNRKGIGISSTTDNAGLLVNTLASGKLTLKSLSGIGDAKGTPAITTSVANGAAGGLIGCVNKGASVEVAGALDVSNLTVTATGDEGAAGGFIGRATNLNLSFANGASVTPALKVGDANTTYAGGAFGDVSFAGTETIESNQFDFAYGKDSTGKDKVLELGAKKRAGGLFGRLDVTNGDVTIQGGTYRSKLMAGQDSGSDRGSYGGIAGNVCGGDGNTIHALVIAKKDASSTQIEIERAAGLCCVGGVVGYQDGDETTQKTAIVLDGADVKINGAAYAYADNGKLGGAVGVVDKNQLLDVRDFKLSSENEIGKQAANGNEKRGGSAGVAGSARRGIIKFSGTTDLSGANFADSDLAAQLVYQNYNALIFATGSGSDDGWAFRRPTKAVPIDDIYSYGEVIRLGGTDGLSNNLIKVDSTNHKLDLGTNRLTKTGDAYVLNSAGDFAKIAITWQTFGYFSMVDGIGDGSVKDLASSTINVADTINLAGTGLTGLSKDRSDPGNNEGKADGGDEREDAHYFSGTLTGNGTIKLAVGEPYGMRENATIGTDDTSAGNGKIYRHQRLGLFNALTGNAVVQGVTIGGTMQFDNKNDVDAGVLAATFNGTSLTTAAAHFTAAITYDNTAEDKTLNVGGILGSVSGAGSIEFSGSSESKGSIESRVQEQSNPRVGGAIGYIAGDSTAVVNASGLIVGSNISIRDYKGQALAGGFIGYIDQGNVLDGKGNLQTKGGIKKVNITGLSFRDFVLTTVAKNANKKYAGGLLGYSWGNTEATIGGDANNSDSSYALTTDKASVTADSATEFGGLLYVMSGHLVIQNHALDLTGASLSATSATSFGVLLARGGTSDSGHAFGVETKYTGLYLEDKTPWGEAYRVAEGNNKLNLSVKSDVKNFDEWIADTTKPGSKTMNGDCNAVISLRTSGNDDKLYMGSDSGKDNSYQNRTDFGNNKVNENARYYYNLDACLSKATKNRKYEGNDTLVKNANSSQYWVKSPEALMIWSACRYAPADIRDYIAPELSFNSSAIVQIGNTNLEKDNSNYTTIDLEGYSYYPVDASGAAYIRNATIKFCYSKIKDEQSAAANKSNAAYTQHANMHMALFRVVGGNFEATNVTLGGTVGRLVDGSDSSVNPSVGSGTTNSGALICRSMTGASSKPLTAKLSGIHLDGLVVDGANQKKTDGTGAYVYAPLLINDIFSYVSLDAQDISVVKDSAGKSSYAGENGKLQLAASSLFGKFGVIIKSGNNITYASTGISASLHDGIELPSCKNEGQGIFTRASFFDSFGYGSSGSTGSANYIFYSTDDKVTYGAEIDSIYSKADLRGTEVDKQLWYYDAPDYGNKDAKNDDAHKNLVTDGEITANKSDNNAPRFQNKYLPYVYNRDCNNPAYREIKVNQRADHLVKGCGTYSDPYAIENASELRTVSNYINNAGTAVDGWKITVTANQDEVCERRGSQKADAEVVYQYSYSDGGKWVKVGDSSAGAPELDKETMHRYIQSAYYSIEPADKSNTIEVDAASFNGFGNHDNPFRGVIVGNLSSGGSNATISIKNASGNTFGLVPYSYGSVVRNLNVKYNGGANNVAYDGKYDNDATPKAVFGGVIGCIMGGDNIIDGVSVSSGGFSVAGANNADDVKSYLVPVGGYVGAICGGGVIFRNSDKTENGLCNWRSDTADDKKLYDNPYVGRVIDGYAFSEGENLTIENGNENYKINRLDAEDTRCITTDTLHPRDGNTEGKATTITVKDKQGLLVLSAIINSGAAAGPTWNSDKYYGYYSGVAAYKGSKAKTGSYSFGNGGYGKVRNATYAAVGKPNEAAADLAIANQDDQQTPGAQSDCVSNAVTNDTVVNSPYLVAKYADKLTGYICGPNVSGVKLQFGATATSDETSNAKMFDMRDYGSGFLGLSGRYYSNACNGGEKSQDRDRIMPAIGCIDGNGSTILVNNQTKQYDDDDYSAQAVGGLFSAVMFANLSGSRGEDGWLVKNLQFGDADKGVDDTKSSTVSLTFINGTTGQETSTPKDDNYCVGMLAGATANRESLNSSGGYFNIRMESCLVKGLKMTGGLLGASGWARRENGSITSSMIHYADDGTDDDKLKQSPVKLFNCSYDDIAVSGGSRVGGFVGAVGSGSDSGIWITSEESNFAVGKGSTIEATAKNCILGGAFGLSWSPIRVNVPLDGNDSQSYKTAKMHAVEIKNYCAVDSEGDGATHRGTGGIVGNTQSGCEIKNVLIEGESAESPMVIGGTVLPDNKDNKFQSAGGVVGQVNGVNATSSFDDVTVKHVKFKAKEGAGGIVGTVFDGSKVQCNDVNIDDIAFNGDVSEDGTVAVANTYSGGLVGTIKNPAATVEAWNIRVANCVFPSEACAAIAGDGKGTFRLSNVLIYKNAYQSKDSQGLLLGKTWSAGLDKDLRGLYVAGLDVVPEDGKKTSDLPDYDAPAANSSADLPAIRRSIHKVSFVALADYNDVSTKADATGHYAGDGSGLYNDEGAAAIASATPYVTTNPVANNPKVKTSDAAGASEYSLFSDGVSIDTAATIQADVKNASGGGETTGSYTYTNIGGRDNNGDYQNANSYAPKSKSTFKASNPSMSEQVAKALTDFNVLVIPGNDTTTVTDYLNLVTNGGFSDAVRLNPAEKGNSSFVTAKAEMLTLQNGAFVRSEDAASLRVVKNGADGMSFRASTSWDNNMSRFTLLTVTFNDGADHTYKVQVPIVVKRMLEIDFSATYTYGTNYKASAYDNLKDHVLTGMGDTMTGYLTWTYNEAKGDQTVRYGLDTLLESGGKLGPVEKSIVFGGDKAAGSLPAGTQLTLVDTRNNDKQYTYTVEAADTSSSGEKAVTTIPLTKFVDSSSSANSYQGQWLSELMGVTAKQDNDGTWVKTEDASNAVAKVSTGDNQGYYRLLNDGEAINEKDRYKLSLRNDGGESLEKTVSENFFLVVRVPTGSSKNVNGFTTTAVSAEGINTNVSDVRRYDKSITDGHSNNESTYGIAASYGQTLTDNKNPADSDSVVQMSLADQDTVYKNLKFDVTDTITLGQNEYNSNDALYFQLDSSLAQFKDGGSAGAVGYPKGATIKNLTFYVMVGNAYYTVKKLVDDKGNVTWEWSSPEGTESVPLVTKDDFKHNGGDLSLVLTDGANVNSGDTINLQGIRDKAKSNGGQFSIRVTGEVEMTEPQCEAAIVASTDNGVNGYTKPTYRSFLSTHADSLSTSSTTADNEGGVRYYRQGIGSSTIALVASKKIQLGINVNDLNSEADGTVALVGTYDMSKLGGADAKIAAAKTLTYTLTLQRRTDKADGSSSYENVKDIGKYITVKESDDLGTGTVSSDGKSIVFTDGGGTGNFLTRDGTSPAFKHRFVVKVNTNVEGANPQQFYANYRLVLTAQLSGDAGTIDTPVNADSIAGYPDSDYVTYTLTKVRLKGIDHGNNN